MKRLPLIVIETIDHSASVGGAQEVAGPAPMTVCGWLVEETEQGYLLAHSVFEHNPKDEHNATSFTAKIPGQKVKRIR